MSDRAFLDTNILIYYLSDDPRAEKAELLLIEGGVISAHVLNEFVNMARRKLGMSWTNLHESLATIKLFCRRILPVREQTHNLAAAIAERYQYRIYDSLMIASALEARCKTLYSEDMHGGQVIEGRLTITNPFASP